MQNVFAILYLWDFVLNYPQATLAGLILLIAEDLGAAIFI